MSLEFGQAQLVAGAAVLCVAYFVRGIAGFGSGLIAIPLLAFLLPLPVVVPLVVALDYAASATMGVSNRADIQWREVFPLVPACFLGTAIAFLVLANMDTQMLVFGLAGFITLFGLYSLSGHAPKLGVARSWGVVAGVAGGIVHVLFGTGGPFYATYFKARGLGKDAFRATFAAVFLIDGAGRLLGFVGTGHYTLSLLLLLAMALPVMAVSLYVGSQVHTSISQITFQRGISVLLIGSGIALLMR